MLSLSVTHPILYFSSLLSLLFQIKYYSFVEQFKNFVGGFLHKSQEEWYGKRIEYEESLNKGTRESMDHKTHMLELC